ncbi:MAG: hypothetical protein RIK87_12300, partial [Fuerstiella sp.]
MKTRTGAEGISRSASVLKLDYNALKKRVARRILELMGERFRKKPPKEDDQDPDRTGLFTSGVVATLDGARIALFFSGRRHAGENLSTV